MRTQKAILLLLLTGMIFSACEKIIDINVPDKSRKIVLNAFIDPDNEVVVSLTQSKSILEDNSILFLKDADVKLFENDIAVGILEYLENDKYILHDYYPSIGRNYKIVVDHEILETAEAEVSIPEVIDIIDIDTSSSINDWGDRIQELNVGIDDPIGVKNYYALSLTMTQKIFDWDNQVYLDSTETYSVYVTALNDVENELGDGLIENNLSFYADDKLFFSDDIFAGQGSNRELALEYYMYNRGDTVRMDVHLDHVDPSYFYYSISKEKYYNATENPFAEPVQVYSNVQNGFGILSSYSRVSRSYTILGGGDK